jgi:hypothetical protein
MSIDEVPAQHNNWKGSIEHSPAEPVVSDNPIIPHSEGIKHPVIADDEQKKIYRNLTILYVVAFIALLVYIFITMVEFIKLIGGAM